MLRRVKRLVRWIRDGRELAQNTNNTLFYLADQINSIEIKLDALSRPAVPPAESSAPGKLMTDRALFMGLPPSLAAQVDWERMGMESPE